MERTRIQKYYNHVIVEDLILILNCKNIMELPAIKRIILSTSSQSFGVEKQEIINAFAIYLLLSGQKGVSTRARNSIAAFGVRKNSIIGCLVTLRKERLYAFFDKLISFVLPRERLQPNVNRLLKVKFCDSKKSNQSLLLRVHTFATQMSDSKCIQMDWSEKKTREFHLGISESRSFPEIENLFERFTSSRTQSQAVLVSLGLNISFSIKTSRLQSFKSCNAFVYKCTANLSKTYQSHYSCSNKNLLGKEMPKTYDKDLLFLSAFQFPCT